MSGIVVPVTVTVWSGLGHCIALRRVYDYQVLQVEHMLSYRGDHVVPAAIFHIVDCVTGSK